MVINHIYGNDNTDDDGGYSDYYDGDDDDADDGDICSDCGDGGDEGDDTGYDGYGDDTGDTYCRYVHDDGETVMFVMRTTIIIVISTSIPTASSYVSTS